MIDQQAPLDPQRPSMMRIHYFILVFLLSTFFLGRILWPFWSIMVLSFILSSLFRPVYVFFNRRFSESLASIITCFLIVIIVFVPIFFFISALSNEALSLYNWGRDAKIGTTLQALTQKSEIVGQIQTYLESFGLDFQPAQISETITSVAKQGGLFLYNQARSWAANIMQFVFMFFMMILVIFFLLIDLDKLLSFIIKLSPLPDDEDRLLLAKFEEIANAILKGNGICGLIQGTIGGAVFAIMGLNSPILWGGLMVILAFLPIFGIGMVMVPAALILALNDRMSAGIFLFFFYLVLSFSMEYGVKPKMVGNQVKMHTLLVFLAIIGGINVYGILGIIYGPLIITAFMTLSDIYLKKYDQQIQRI